MPLRKNKIYKRQLFCQSPNCVLLVTKLLLVAKVCTLFDSGFSGIWGCWSKCRILLWPPLLFLHTGLLQRHITHFRFLNIVLWFFNFYFLHLPGKQWLGSDYLILGPLPLLHSLLPLHCREKRHLQKQSSWKLMALLATKCIQMLWLLILFLLFLFFLLRRFSFSQNVFRTSIAEMPRILQDIQDTKKMQFYF